jgi:flagellar basal-body rod protein FlgB
MAVGNDPVNQSLKAAIDLRWRRHELLSHNLANADTPGFRPKDLEFEGVLQSAMQGGEVAMAEVPRATGHASVGMGNADEGKVAQEVIERPEIGDTLDDNATDTDREMGRIADNSLYYQTSLELLRRRYAAVQRVISDMART